MTGVASYRIEQTVNQWLEISQIDRLFPVLGSTAFVLSQNVTKRAGR